MNIAILSRGEHLYSTQQLLRAAQANNHNVEVIDPTYCNVYIKNGKPIVQFHDEVIDDLDAIIPRIGASNTYYGTSLVRQFEAIHVFSTASSQGIVKSRDKWTSFQILSKAGVPVPKTTLAVQNYLVDFVKDYGEGPVIIKLIEGTHGEGVILCESQSNAIATAETLMSSRIKFVIQEYIAESKGTDVRVIVVDGTVVAAMKRTAQQGEFRSNLHRGGTATTFTITNEVEQIAINAARALDLGVCGVDILQSNKGPLVLEVNSTPGLEGIEKTTKINVAEKIISYIEQNNALK